MKRLPTASPDGLAAAVLLSFLATAGLFYVNIMAALVSGLIDGLHISEKQAGFVASANVYGAALGALISVFFVKRVPWRPVAVVLLVLLMTLDMTSTLIRSAPVLIALRFVHGSVGGMLVGTGFSVIARTRMPDRTFGMLLVVQFGMGGLGVMFLPRLVPVFGTSVLFLTLAAFSLSTLAMVPFLADYPAPKAGPATPAGAPTGVVWLPLGLALLAVVLFQAGNMALAAYMIELGRFYGLKTGFISTTLGIAGWIGALGSLAVVVIGTRYGRFRPLLAALAATVLGNALFHFSAQPGVYALANAGTAMTWSFAISYLLGMCAAFDPGGQTAALGGFFSKVGLATGPLCAGIVLEGAHFGRLIDIAVTALALAAAAALIPAARLDHAARLQTAPALTGADS